VKRLLLGTLTTVVFCVALAVPALASYPPKPGNPGDPVGNTNPAFTGASITNGILLLAGLLLVGILALALSRRRASRT